MRIHVADTGRGIPASRQREIFEPFVQVDRHLTPDGDQGIGLGLAISARAGAGDGWGSDGRERGRSRARRSLCSLKRCRPEGSGRELKPSSAREKAAT